MISRFERVSNYVIVIALTVGVLFPVAWFVLTSLSEEHGVIELDAASQWPPVGERVHIIPNHACVVSNLFDRVHLVAPDGQVEVVPVDARGRSD